DLLRIGVDAHPLLDQACHAREADRELVRDQLANRPDPAIAEMVDVVGVTTAVVQVDQVLHDRDEVFLGQHRVVRVDLEPQPLVDLVAADTAEIVALRVEEELLDLLARGLEIGRITRTQQRIDLLERLLIRNTLSKDPTRSEQEALEQIYALLRAPPAPNGSGPWTACCGSAATRHDRQAAAPRPW